MERRGQFIAFIGLGVLEWQQHRPSAWMPQSGSCELAAEQSEAPFPTLCYGDPRTTDHGVKHDQDGKIGYMGLRAECFDRIIPASAGIPKNRGNFIRN